MKHRRLIHSASRFSQHRSQDNAVWPLMLAILFLEIGPGQSAEPAENPAPQLKARTGLKSFELSKLQVTEAAPAQKHIVQRGEIASFDASRLSIMPTGIEALPPDDLKSLIDYLAQLH